MRCYRIEKGQAIKGFSAGLLPVEGIFDKDTICNADIELIGNDDLGVDLEELKDMSIQRLSAVCRVQLVPTKRVNNDLAIVVYAPSEAYLDRDGGDESAIVHRSPTLFAAIAYRDRTCLRFFKSEGVVLFNANGVYVDKGNVPPTKKRRDAFIIKIS